MAWTKRGQERDERDRKAREKVERMRKDKQRREGGMSKELANDLNAIERQHGRENKWF